MMSKKQARRFIQKVERAATLVSLPLAAETINKDLADAAQSAEEESFH